jgi:gamma-glutamyltranspeptidase/glutathione hydrolase
VIRGARAAATQTFAAEAAEAVLAGGGGAVDAVIAGFFAAAGACPSALLAPSVALVAGFGAGGRVFDGRAAQPGRGAPRPRGFVDEREIPVAARVATPRSIPMLVLLSGYRGKASLAELARAGVATAESAGAKGRARFLRHVGATGVLAMRAPEVQAALLAAAGPMAGGTLTADDLQQATPTEGEAEARALDAGTTVIVPPFPAPEGSLHHVECVVTCDGRGVLAAIAYGLAPDALLVPDLEVALPVGAAPVRRGVTRVAPGTVLPAPHPIAIATQPGGFSAAVGLADGARLEPGDLAWVTGGTPLEAALAEMRVKSGARAAVAVLTDGKTARDARNSSGVASDP